MISSVIYSILLSYFEVKHDIELESSKIWLVRQRKICIPAAKFDNFANGNSISARYYFVLFLKAICTLIILQSWMFTIIVDLFVTFQNLAFKIKTTLHCCEIDNYKLLTMFHLYIKYFMHKFAIVILCLNKGDSWTNLKCCGVLINFFSFFALFHIHQNRLCFFKGSVGFCVINLEICNRMYITVLLFVFSDVAPPTTGVIHDVVYEEDTGIRHQGSQVNGNQPSGIWSFMMQ